METHKTMSDSENGFVSGDVSTATPGAFVDPAGNFNESGKIIEGFLCPVCKSDLRSPERLTLHVEHEHSDEQDLLRSLKEMFNFARQGITLKAKKKNSLMSTISEPSSNILEAAIYSSGAKIPTGLTQELVKQVIGYYCDHSMYFKAVRNPRLERYAAETNKLIIRLDKLLHDCPTDVDQKKRHEQSKVPWVNGKLVKLCPGCAKSFGITRRQHHCRLCGAVMCVNCSLYLSFKDAHRIIQPSSICLTSVMAEAYIDDKETSSMLQNNLNSFRICDHCMHLLMNRMEMQDSLYNQSQMAKVYERLYQERAAIEPNVPMYRQILDSLYEGDIMFRLSDATILREKIGRAAEQLDIISKTILGLPFATGSREEALKKAIRLACISYIKEQMLSIPALPLEEEIKKIQLRNKQETVRRLEQERMLALEAYERYELQLTVGADFSNTNAVPRTKAVNGRYGVAQWAMDNWSGTQVGATNTSNSDPLIDQINIVKGYIKQAREAMRFEEIVTLERNLTELTQEFYCQQQLIDKNQHVNNK
ncbi:rabenosyn-5 [Anopheles nili]|uniref:rabenosyn-5 n=1 Tax=Anopheles nili TaxID=185578 RepID=UPI00237B671F|nr:rabenosyn-5 [Anopheles nili]